MLTTGEYAGQQALFVVEVDAPGVRPVRTPAYTHTIGHGHAIVAFEGVRVPRTSWSGPRRTGCRSSTSGSGIERLMVAARCLGAAERLVEEATAFAKDRTSGGAPLIDRQLVQGMLADSVTELFAARAMTYETRPARSTGRRREGLHAGVDGKLTPRR